MLYQGTEQCDKLLRVHVVCCSIDVFTILTLLRGWLSQQGLER